MGDRNLTATFVMAVPMTDTFAVLADAVVRGELRVPITKTYSLEEVPHALKHFTSGKLGKIAVAVSWPDRGNVG